MSWFLLTDESAIPGENPWVELKSTKAQPTYINYGGSGGRYDWYHYASLILVIGLVATFISCSHLKELKYEKHSGGKKFYQLNSEF